MHRKKKAWVALIVIFIAIKIFAAFPTAVEQYYSNGLYVFISGLQRILFGWIPFSAGDLIYIAAGILLIRKITVLIKLIWQRRTGRRTWIHACRWLLYYGVFVYCLFNILWGLNYNRIGVAKQLDLKMRYYSTADLMIVMRVLAVQLDSLGVNGREGRDSLHVKKHLFRQVRGAYDGSAGRYHFLGYRINSIKPSLFSYLGNYMGYSGYYNPFTGEAQVNTTVPVFMQPFTACHEVGHQLGYAKENEANFAGYLSAKSSPDPLFRYSVYFDMYAYGLRELYVRDSVAAVAMRIYQPKGVRADFATLKKFYADYRNPVEPYIRMMYAQYLRANEQPSGMESYSQVMAFLVAYYKKYGEL